MDLETNPMAVLIALVSLVVPVGGSSSLEPVSVFDFDFVDGALEYLATGDDATLQSVASSDAAMHLAVHASRVSLDGKEQSPREVTEGLLRPRREKAENAQAVRQLLSAVRQDARRQEACLSEVVAHLPEGSLTGARLYFTYGYDIGVAVSGNASLNLAHEHFLQDREEIWFYCVHELHHAGFQVFHDLPKLAELDTTSDLLGLVEYATQLEGTAVYAAWDWRERAGALAGDEDYRALLDNDLMARLEQEYFEIYDRLRSEPARPLVDSDWAILDRMSGGDRLWYRVGALMAAAIDTARGREELCRLVEAGPRAFIDAYRASCAEGALPN